MVMLKSHVLMLSSNFIIALEYLYINSWSSTIPIPRDYQSIFNLKLLHKYGCTMISPGVFFFLSVIIRGEYPYFRIVPMHVLCPPPNSRFQYK